MRSIIKASLATAAATGTIIVGGAIAPANAAPPVAVGNLVNVQISNVLNNNDVVVSVPINAAAAICGVNVAVLAETAPSDVVCDVRGNQRVSILQ